MSNFSTSLRRMEHFTLVGPFNNRFTMLWISKQYLRFYGYDIDYDFDFDC